MKEFIPSGSFVTKTMDKINSYESAQSKKKEMHSKVFSPLLLRTGAFSAGFVFVIINILRLYLTVFAPVVSH